MSKHPLYVTIIDGHFVRCRIDGIVNWTSTRHYTVDEMQGELQSGQEITLVQHLGDENKTETGPDWMSKILKGL
jgi:hypothetical protein